MSYSNGNPGLAVHLRELVDGDDNFETELLGVLNVLAQVGTALLEELEVLLLVYVSQGLSGGDGRATSVHLEGSDSSDNDNSVGLEVRNSALDVTELY